MKRQDLIKYHQLPSKDLKVEVQKLEAQVAMLNLQLKKSEVKNVHAAKSVRQDIARIKTIIRHKELSLDSTPAPKTAVKPAPKPPAAKPAAKKTTKSVKTKSTNKKTKKA